jgi:hypothetical protein
MYRNSQLPQPPEGCLTGTVPPDSSGQTDDEADLERSQAEQNAKLDKSGDPPDTDMPADSCPNSNPTDSPCRSDIVEIRRSLAVLSGKVDSFAEAVGRSSILEEEYRRLAEEFYEREVLQPVLLRLISLGDRVRQQATALDETRRLQAHCGQTNALTQSGVALDLLRSIVADIHSLLASFAVVPFEKDSVRFDASTQECVPNSFPGDQNVHGLIADRVAPGYSRHGRIIRPELVRIYINASNATAQ